MVLIPAGEFQMGSNAPEAKNDEQPVHTVYIAMPEGTSPFFGFRCAKSQ